MDCTFKRIDRKRTKVKNPNGVNEPIMRSRRIKRPITCLTNTPKTLKTCAVDDMDELFIDFDISVNRIF